MTIRELKYLHIEVCIPLYVRMGHCNVHGDDDDEDDDGDEDDDDDDDTKILYGNGALFMGCYHNRNHCTGCTKGKCPIRKINPNIQRNVFTDTELHQNSALKFKLGKSVGFMWLLLEALNQKNQSGHIQRNISM